MGDIKAEYRVFNKIRFGSEEKQLRSKVIVFAVRPIIYRQIKDGRRGGPLHLHCRTGGGGDEPPVV